MGITTRARFMKINEQVPLAHLPIANHGYEDNFSDWLLSPTLTQNGDEYYRQHQGDLQPSALTFKALTIDANSKHPLNDSMTLITHPNSSFTTTENTFLPDMTPKDASQIAIKANQMTDTNAEIDALLTTIHTTITNYLVTTHKPMVFENISRQPNKAMTNYQTTEPSASIATHQLFIMGHEVELALNTHNLSKKDAKELEQCIKKALLSKGYYLSTLIINGVTQ